MKKLFLSLICLMLVCRIFIVKESRDEKIVQREIEQWLTGKNIISIRQTSSGGSTGFGGSVYTCITIIAETEKDK